MVYLIKARYVADTFGLITKGSELIEFNSKKEARSYGQSNLEGTLYLASWEALTKEDARKQGFDVS